MKNRLFPLRTAARVAWALLFCVLLLLPLGLIYFVTQGEMRRYAVADVPSVTLRSYGAPSQVVRRDVAEYVVVSGQYISNRRFFMELPALNRQYEARWQVREGDYIEAGGRHRLDGGREGGDRCDGFRLPRGDPSGAKQLSGA